MKAWILSDKCRLELRDLPKPSPAEDEVLVKISYVGLCGSDIEIYQGHRDPEILADPLILGHEASGVVEECGKNVTAFEPGDSVVLRGVWGCCAEYVTATVISPPDSRSARFLQILKLPAGIPNRGASLLEVLPKIIMTAERVRITPATDVIILGQGVTGLLMTQMVNLQSPHRLVTVDLFEEKLALSKKMGATHTLCRRDPDYHEKLSAILPDGADLVIPCYLEGDGVSEAIELLKWRGRIMLWGCLGRAEIDFFRLHTHGGDILAAQANDLSEDIRYCQKAVQYLQQGIVRIQELTTDVIAFDQMDDAFEMRTAPSGEVVHVLVEM